MRTVFSVDHAFQNGRSELIDGQIHPPVEKPARAEAIHRAVEAAGLGKIVAPDPLDEAALAWVHTPRYLTFLREAWDAWTRAHGTWDALPLAWPCRPLSRREPQAIDGRLGYFSFDAGTPITGGTWQAATASASVALTGAALVSGGERAVFSLCRPPGHHAAAELYGGYCFLNNAAIAAEAFRANGAERVAVFDVDYHHGNGTQAIFYDRADVLYASIHADPRQDFPFFLGYADEAGAGAGAGANLNYPLALGTGWNTGYADALRDAIARIDRFGADAVIVSLGVDTYDGDPISGFKLKTDEFPKLGAALAGLGRPTLFVMEGGYAVDALGDNVAATLSGFESA